MWYGHTQMATYEIWKEMMQENQCNYHCGKERGKYLSFSFFVPPFFFLKDKLFFLHVTLPSFLHHNNILFRFEWCNSLAVHSSWLTFIFFNPLVFPPLSFNLSRKYFYFPPLEMDFPLFFFPKDFLAENRFFSLRFQCISRSFSFPLSFPNRTPSSLSHRMCIFHFSRHLILSFMNLFRFSLFLLATLFLGAESVPTIAGYSARDLSAVGGKGLRITATVNTGGAP